MERVLIAGTSSTSFGEHPETAGRELFAEAATGALSDADVADEDVDALYYGNFMGEIAEKQGHQGPLMASMAGLPVVPATRVESACASGGYAVAEAVSAIRGGMADVVLVGGAERMTNLDTPAVTDALARAADDLHEVRPGITFPGAYALLATAYMDEYGGARDDLAAIAQKNHANAASNPKAQFQFEITKEKALDAPMVAEPLGLYDACPITDGASALVMVSESFASEIGLDATVAVTGSGKGTAPLALQERDSLVETTAAADAAKTAYEQAGIDPDDIDLAEVHDCFTIAEVLALEALGLYDAGEAISAANDGETTADGDVPVNLSGGLKAKGHPVGTTGVSQLVELTHLLEGDHPNADAVPEATIGVTHNAGGTVASAAVHVLEVVA
ncbi:MAG: thiolase domain-containing protein [Halobacteriota archaeon]